MSAVQKKARSVQDVEPLADAVYGVADNSGLLVWKVHLARQNPGVLPAIVCSIVIASVLAALLLHSFLAGFLAIVLLGGAIREYLFPVEYRITPQAVQCVLPGTNSEVMWKDARRIMVDGRCVTVTSLEKPGRLDVFRGVSLRFAPIGAPGNRQQVLSLCKRYAGNLIGAEALTQPASDAEEAEPHQ